MGYPNFAFANVLSPLSLQQSVTDFIQALAAGGSIAAGRFLNVMSQSVVYNAPPGPGSGYAAAGPPPGQQSENLYFYRRTGVTMKKGDRTRFSLLNTNVACEHLYQWEISDSMNIDDRGYRLNQESKPENWVWHVLRLENQSAHPWTTAPA